MAITLEDEEIASSRIRSSEIKNLVSTINDLAVLFKELSILVVEQGTILDRIDYNIECAHKDTKQAVVHLEKTIEIETSMRSKSLLMCLISSILLCLILLVLKHTWLIIILKIIKYGWRNWDLDPIRWISVPFNEGSAFLLAGHQFQWWPQASLLKLLLYWYKKRLHHHLRIKGRGRNSIWAA